MLVLCSKCTIPKYDLLSSNKTYRAVIPKYLRGGGDGYTMFNKTPIRDLHISNTNALAEFIQKEDLIYTAVENRIVISGV